jgi:hypothetical protein
MTDKPNPYADGVCPHGENRAKGSGCIKPNGHAGAHCVVPGEPDEDDLCTSEFPGDDLHAGQLCDQFAGHDGDHAAVAELSGTGYERHLTWAATPDQP